MKTLLLATLLLSLNALAECGPRQVSAPTQQCSASGEFCGGDMAFYLGNSDGPILGQVLSAQGRRLVVRLQLRNGSRTETADEQNFIKSANGSSVGTNVVCSRDYCVGDQIVYHGTGGDLGTVVGISRGWMVAKMSEGSKRGQYLYAQAQGNFSCAQ